MKRLSLIIVGIGFITTTTVAQTSVKTEKVEKSAKAVNTTVTEPTSNTPVASEQGESTPKPVKPHPHPKATAKPVRVAPMKANTRAIKAE